MPQFKSNGKLENDFLTIEKENSIKKSFLDKKFYINNRQYKQLYQKDENTKKDSFYMLAKNVKIPRRKTLKDTFIETNNSYAKLYGRQRKGCPHASLRLRNHLFMRNSRRILRLTPPIIVGTTKGKIKKAFLVNPTMQSGYTPNSLRRFICAECPAEYHVVIDIDKTPFHTCTSCNKQFNILDNSLISIPRNFELVPTVNVATIDNNDACYIVFENHRSYVYKPIPNIFDNEQPYIKPRYPAINKKILAIGYRPSKVKKVKPPKVQTKDQIISYESVDYKWMINKKTGFISCYKNGIYHNILAQNRYVTPPVEFIERMGKVFDSLNIPCDNIPITALYKVSRNKMWQEIGTSSVLSIDPKFARRLAYQHKKHGTKKARELFYGTKSKALINQIISSSESNYSITFTKILTSLGYDDNHIMSVLKHRQAAKAISISDGSTSYQYQGNDTLVQLLLSFIKFLQNSLGSKVKVINYLCKVEYRDHTLLDTAKQLKDLLAIKPEYSITSKLSDKLLEVERIISRDYRLIVKEANRPLAITKYEKTSNNSFSIEQATMSHELVQIGHDLNICVGSYTNAAIKGDCFIFHVKETQTGNSFACIEVNKNKAIVQAKMKRNEQVLKNQELLSFVKEWAALCSFNNNTHDLLHPYSTWYF
jgi:hypothetical protein